MSNVRVPRPLAGLLDPPDKSPEHEVRWDILFQVEANNGSYPER